MLAHICFLSLVIFTYLKFPFLLSNEWALYNNRADTCCNFSIFRWSPLCCRAEPDSLHIQLRESELKSWQFQFPNWSTSLYLQHLVCIGTPAFYSKNYCNVIGYQDGNRSNMQQITNNCGSSFCTDIYRYGSIHRTLQPNGWLLHISWEGWRRTNSSTIYSLLSLSEGSWRPSGLSGPQVERRKEARRTYSHSIKCEKLLL